MQRMRRVSIVAMVAIAVAVVFVTHVPVEARPSRAERERAREMLAEVRDQAVRQVLDAARSDDAALRANAIEAVQALPRRARPVAQLGVEDENPAVRFSALVTIGKLSLEGLGEASRRIARDTNEHPSVRAAALYAARRCGEDVDISPMAELLASPEPTVRANAAMLLGMLGDVSAVEMLEELAARPMPRARVERAALVRLQIAEALVRLGEEDALDAIRAGAYSAHGEVRVLAVQTLGKLNDRRMEAAYAQIVEGDNPIELRLAAAEALVRIDGEAELDVMEEGAAWDNPAIRTQAAFTLGLVAHPQAASRLRQLLEDEQERPQVRLAAATAILRALERSQDAQQ